MHQKQKDWDMVGPLDDRSVKGLLMEDKEIAEKLNKCFALVFTVEDVFCPNWSSDRYPCLNCFFQGERMKS